MGTGRLKSQLPSVASRRYEVCAPSPSVGLHYRKSRLKVVLRRGHLTLTKTKQNCCPLLKHFYPASTISRWYKGCWHTHHQRWTLAFPGTTASRVNAPCNGQTHIKLQGTQLPRDTIYKLTQLSQSLHRLSQSRNPPGQQRCSGEKPGSATQNSIVPPRRPNSAERSCTEQRSGDARRGRSWCLTQIILTVLLLCSGN